MTVIELIERLQKCDPNALVLISRYGGPWCQPLVREARGLPAHKGRDDEFWLEDAKHSLDEEKQYREEDQEEIGDEIKAVALE